ncbi:MAG: hypothetical protein LC790_05430, partial [Actinobacteria bacterium]|nr:hypothetical protein [Actinomycetota bacterium]
HPRLQTAPVYRGRYQQTNARIGKQRGAKVAQVDLARRLSEAIWHMLTRDQAFAPKAPPTPWRLTVLKELRHRSEPQSALSSPSRRR